MPDTTGPEITTPLQPRAPERDPTLGIEINPPPVRHATAHPLVTLGDSLTMGFKSGAIAEGHLSWPAIVGAALGVEVTVAQMEPGDSRVGGLPLDLELLLRGLAERFGPTLGFGEFTRAALHLYRRFDAIEQWWEGATGAPPADAPVPHNLAVYGWDLRDALSLDTTILRARIDAAGSQDESNLRGPAISEDSARAALRVFAPIERLAGGPVTMVSAAEVLGRDGIDTLSVMLGANNALGSVTTLKVSLTNEAYGNLEPPDQLVYKCSQGFNVWSVAHFRSEWAELVDAIRKVRANRVIVSTVPSVTIAPVARAIGGKLHERSWFFEYYARPWVTTDEFDPALDHHLTGAQARFVDESIDVFNSVIIESVRAARTNGLDWYLFDLAALLDSAATKRYHLDPSARPHWWEPYEYPPPLAALDPPLNTRFFDAEDGARTDGGIFSLDGVHPTTLGYGIVADAVLAVMKQAGAASATASVDWDRLIDQDTLNADPPTNLGWVMDLIAWLDMKHDLVTGPFHG